MSVIGNTLAGSSTRPLDTLTRAIDVPSWPTSGSLNSLTARIVGTAGGEFQAGIYNGSGVVLAASSVRTDIGALGNYTFTGFGAFNFVAGTNYKLAIGSNDVTGLLAFNGAAELYEGQAPGDVSGVDPMTSPITFSADPTRDYAIQVDQTDAGASGSGAPKRYDYASHLLL